MSEGLGLRVGLDNCQRHWINPKRPRICLLSYVFGNLQGCLFSFKVESCGLGHGAEKQQVGFQSLVEK